MTNPSAVKKALICGVSGQDGAYLSALLLSKGYTVFGTSRDASARSFGGLVSLGISERVKLLSMALNEFEGTVMLVSHDRALLRAVCDEFWMVSRGGVEPFDGDLFRRSPGECGDCGSLAKGRRTTARGGDGLGWGNPHGARDSHLASARETAA